METKSILTVEQFHDQCAHLMNKSFDLLAYSDCFASAGDAAKAGCCNTIESVEGYDNACAALNSYQNFCAAHSFGDHIAYAVAVEF